MINRVGAWAADEAEALGLPQEATPGFGEAMVRGASGRLFDPARLSEMREFLGRRAVAAAAPEAWDPVGFAALSLAEGLDAASSLVEGLLARGHSFESVCLDLLAPAAAHLGTLWAEDECSFADVTLGVGRLHQIMRYMAAGLPQTFFPEGAAPRAMLVCAPDETHTFGLSMLAEFFRRGGWDVWGGPNTAMADLLSGVRSSHFDVLGVSVSHNGHLEMIRNLIRQVRRVSLNRKIFVFVGGSLFLREPDRVREVGADAMSADAREALLTANKARGRHG